MLLKRLVSSQQFLDQTYRDLCDLLNKQGHFHIEVKEGQRSLDQNALYWVWMPHIQKYLNDTKPKILNDETGEWEYPDDYNKSEAHMIVKKLFLGVEPAIMKGDEVFISEQVRSTKGLSVGEMYDFMTKIHHWMVSRDVYLPLPEDSQYVELMNRQVR